MSKRELKKQQERAAKHGCDGRCYWETGMCPAVQVAMGVTFAVTNTLEAQKPQAQPQGINPGALLAAMFANAVRQQPRDDIENESDDDE